MIAGPFIKWVGGKRQLLPQILPLVPSRIAAYYEPFIGGGALFFELARLGRFRRAVIGDRNARLARTYRAIRDHVDDVVWALEAHQKLHGEAHYYATRDVDPEGLSDVETAAWFIYLNKTGFNGLYRVNKAGRMNTPWGKYPPGHIFCDADNLRACAAALRGVEIISGPWTETVRDAAGDKRNFVYLDPPYVPMSKTANFAAYDSSGFGRDAQELLADQLRALGAAGIPALLSNADCEATRTLYAGLPIVAVGARRNVNSVASKRGPVGEVLVRSFEYALPRAARVGRVQEDLFAEVG